MLKWNTSENFCVQGFSRGKVNILGGDNIGHCEDKSSYKQVSNSDWLPRETCLYLQIYNHSTRK
jgi:hypothetical protein